MIKLQIYYFVNIANYLYDTLSYFNGGNWNG